SRVRTYVCNGAVVLKVHFFFSSRRRHTRFSRDWSSDVCSSDLGAPQAHRPHAHGAPGAKYPAPLDHGRGESLSAIAGWRDVDLKLGRASGRERMHILV